MPPFTQRPGVNLCVPLLANANFSWVWDGEGFQIDQYLNYFIGMHGWPNWVNKMDAAATSGGRQESNLFCGSIDSDNCGQPSLPCSSYSAPQAYFVRKAVANLHTMLRSAKQNLDSETILASLALDRMIEDFGKPDIDAEYEQAHAVNKFLNIFSIILGMLAPALEAEAAGFVAGINGALRLALLDSGGESKADMTQGYKMVLEDTLAQVFTTMRQGLHDYAASVLGAQTPMHLPCLGICPDTPSRRVSDVFAGGRFLLPSGQDPLDDTIVNIFDKGVERMKQYLVGQLLKDLGDYITLEPMDDENKCDGVYAADGIPGMQGECMRLMNKQNKVDPGYKKLKDYGIDLAQIFTSSTDCGSGVDVHGSSSLGILSVGGSEGRLPFCFYSLPVWGKREGN